MESQPRHEDAETAASARQIRGSSLLLAGRGLGWGLELAAQVLLVQHYAKPEYGAFSYALSIVHFAKSVAVFALPDALGRYVPLWRERARSEMVVGAVRLTFTAVLVLSALLVAGLWLAVGVLGLRPTDDPQALALLLLLALLIPLEALDGIFVALLAIFADARTIVLRQSLLTPGLRLGLVLVAIWLGLDVAAFALGYVLIGLVGTAAYALALRRGMRRDMRLRSAARAAVMPARTLFGFAAPVFVSALVWQVMESTDALLLGYLSGTAAVAEFRAVLPVARLNQAAFLTFAVFYLPQAAQLHARGQAAALSELYARTAVWMAVLNLPVFLLTFSFAPGLTRALLGAEYAGSWPVMALVSLAYFVHTALGFNGYTLRMFERLRLLLAIDLGAAALNVGLGVLLVPGLGPLGAALGLATSMTVQGLLRQLALRRCTGITVLRRPYAATYVAVAAVAATLLGVELLLSPPLWVAVPLAGAGALVGLWASRAGLRAAAMFPELFRWPLLRAARPLFDSP